MMGPRSARWLPAALVALVLPLGAAGCVENDQSFVGRAGTDHVLLESRNPEVKTSESYLCRRFRHAMSIECALVVLTG